MSKHEQTTMGKFNGMLALAAGLTVSGMAWAHDYQPDVTKDQEEEHQASFAFELSPGNQFLSIPSFDDQGGTRVLDSAFVEMNGEIAAFVAAEHTGAEALEDWQFEFAGWMAADYAGGASFLESFQNIAAAGTAFGAADDDAGSGDDYRDFGRVAQEINFVRLHTGEELERFQGDGAIQIAVFANAGFGVTPHAGDFAWSIEGFEASGSATVTYTYHPSDSTPCPGDADATGWVEFDDLLFVLATWGQCPVDSACTADFDASGDVGLTDLLQVLSNWGPCHD